MSDLQRLIHVLYTPNPDADTFNAKYGIRDWLADNIRTLTHDTQPHTFKFESNIEGIVIVSYKRFTADENWVCLGELLSHVPTGDPAIIRPIWEKQIPIEKAKSEIKTCRAIMPEAKYNEWCNFLVELEKKQR